MILEYLVGENNRFSSNPDNTKLEYGTPKKWFEEYKNILLVGLRRKNIKN